MTNKWPRKIVVSYGYGAGLASWWHIKEAYDIIESPLTIKAVEEGATWEEFTQRLLDAGYSQDIIDAMYGGGWSNATVVEVPGPYIVTEYDGYESVTVRSQVEWRE